LPDDGIFTKFEMKLKKLVVTEKGWTVRGSNPGVRRDFPHKYIPALKPTQPPIQWVLGLSWG